MSIPLTSDPVMVRSQPVLPAYEEELTTPQKLRAEGKTRRAPVSVRTVSFEKLANRPLTKVVWESVWPAIEYCSVTEANYAAKAWVEKHLIMPPGFSGK